MSMAPQGATLAHAQFNEKHVDDLVKIRASRLTSEKVIHLLIKSFWGGTQREQPRLQNYSLGSGATHVPESLLPQASR